MPKIKKPDNETIVKNFKSRPYQLEILELAKSTNTIVCLSTGSGKTFIGVLLIKEKQNEIKGTFQDNGKRTIFIVNTVPLVDQQKCVIDVHTSLNVGSYTGDMGVDFWDKDRWVDEFNKNDILVMTAQILVNILTHAFFNLANINLLIMDECHNANKNHPYRKILDFFDRCPEPHRPHILGFTASIINEKCDKPGFAALLETKIRGLESRMRARCVTCTDRLQLAKYSTKPKESIKTFQQGYNLNGLDKMENKIKQVETMIEGYQQKFLGKCKEAADIMKYCSKVLRKLGFLCCYWVAKESLEQISKLSSLSEMDNMETLKIALSEVIESFVQCSDEVFESIDDVLPIEPFITRKSVVFLRDIIFKEKKHFKELTAIVFVKTRCTAIILSKLINFMAMKEPRFSGISSNFILGHCMDVKLKLTDRSMSSKEQINILSQFRNGDFNILLSTSVVEEGLDIRECNLVVRFNGIKNYREYVQSKGRARKNNSKFIVLSNIKKGLETRRSLKAMQGIEDILFDICHNRELPTNEEIQEAMFDEEDLLLPTYFSNDTPTAARITKDTAVALLHRYCSLLPSDRYSYANMRPTFTVHDVPQVEAFIVECTLPLNCPLPNRTHKSKPMLRKNLAKKMVCLEICKQLHEIGELDDDHFLPKILDDEDDEDEDDDDEDEYDGDLVIEEEDNENENKERGKAKEKILAYKRKIPSAFLLAGKDITLDDFHLFCIYISLSQMSLRDSTISHWPLWYSEDRPCFGILLPKKVSHMPSLKLYSRVGQLTVQLHKLNLSILGNVALDDIIKFHQGVVEESCKTYSRKNICFDFTNDAVSKALFVPLKAGVMNSLCRGEKQLNGTYIDLSLLLFESGKQIQTDAVICKTYSPKRCYYVTGLSSTTTSDIMEGEKITFKEYYAEKYGLTVSSDEQLLNVVSISTKVSFLSREQGTSKKKRKAVKVEELVPELCKIYSPFPAKLHMQMPHLSFAMFYYEFYWLAVELQQKITDVLKTSSIATELPYLLKEKLAQIDAGSLSPPVEAIFQAITTRQAKMPFDLERLEMLGDSFLKQAISIFLFFSFPNSHEGKLSKKRKSAICNKTLSRIGKRCGLTRVICNSQFGCTTKECNGGKVWLPPGYTAENGCHQQVRCKCIADCVEALIGVYFETGGMNLALHFMQHFLNIDVLHERIEISQQCQLGKSKYADFPKCASSISKDDKVLVCKLYEYMKLDRFEAKLGYTFRDKSHLVQALTHLSYTDNKVTGCYQEYEFLGDALLDFLVTLHVYKQKDDLTPGQLTYLRSALVNNNTFGLLATQNDYYKFLFAKSPALFAAYDYFVKLVNSYGDVGFQECLKNPFVIMTPGSREGHHAPKVLGDLFESVAGAIFLDSGLDLDKVWDVYYSMMRHVCEQYITKTPRNPVVVLSERFPGLEFSYNSIDEKDLVECMVEVKGSKVTACGQNKRIAKASVSRRALDMLSSK